jgi:FkbM family methyltransferase
MISTADRLVQSFVRIAPTLGMKKWIVDTYVRGKAVRPDKEVVVPLLGSTRLKVKLSEAIGQRLYFYGKYEPWATYLIRHFSKPGMCFFDIGANIGYYSLLVAECTQKHCSVHAFEPVMTTFSRLVDNIDRNKMGNCIVANRLALTEQEGPLTMNIYPDPAFNSAATSIDGWINPRYDQAPQIEVVGCSTLDRYVDNMGIRKVDFVKIDVEGHERAVLKGGKEFLWSSQETAVLSECEPTWLSRVGLKVEDVVLFMRDLKYRAYQHSSITGVAEVIYLIDEKDFDGNLLFVKGNVSCDYMIHLGKSYVTWKSKARNLLRTLKHKIYA